MRIPYKICTTLAAVLGLELASCSGDENLTSHRSTLTQDGRYKAMALEIDLNDDGKTDGAVLTDLRAIENIAPTADANLDKHSFASIVQRGNVPNTVFYLTQEAFDEIGRAPLKAELEKIVSPSIERKVVSPNLEADLVNGNLGPLLQEPQSQRYLFQRPSFSHSKEAEISRLPINKKRSLTTPKTVKTCPAIDEKYSGFTTEILWALNPEKTEYACVGVGVDFTRNGDYEAIAVFDLRSLANSSPSQNPINENDIQSIAYWGSAPENVLVVVCTQSAVDEISASPFLRVMIKTRVSETARRKILDDSAQKTALTRGEIESLLPEKQPERTYFNPPRIIPDN